MTDWNRFFTSIRQCEEDLGSPKLVWYQGITDNSSHKLVPSLFQHPTGQQREADLFAKYKQIASRVLEDRHGDWEYLFDMQHYGLPTRLLDWTEVLGNAVFFALSNKEHKTAAVYVLNPVALNELSGKQNIPVVSDEKDFEYRRLYWENYPVRPALPLAVDPPFQNPRIQAQRGKFTLHGNDELPLEILAPDSVRKVPLNRDGKEGAREFLRIAGIDEFRMLPDIVGMVPFVKGLVGLT